MQTSMAALNPRIQRHIRHLGSSRPPLETLRKHPQVLKRFHFMTWEAMEKLDRDPSLLRRLEEHFSRDPVLSRELSRDLMLKNLRVEGYGPGHHIIYGVSGFSHKELRSLDAMAADFAARPIVEDIVALFAAARIEFVVKSGVLSKNEINALNEAFDPRSDTLALMARGGINRVAITDSGGCGITAREEQGTATLFIPRYYLRDAADFSRLLLMVGTMV